MDTNAKPYAVHMPAQVPVHFRDEMKRQLDEDVRLRVIERVLNTPVTWCARLVITTKHDGSPRRTVDFQALNAASVHQTHHARSPYHLAREIPAGMKKTIYDAWNRYHSVLVHEDDRHFITFLTEFGRYRYITLPQGCTASADGYTIRYYQAVEDIPNKKNNVLMIYANLARLWQSVSSNRVVTCKDVEKMG